MRVLALDFDGVISDSFGEVAATAVATWASLEPASALGPAALDEPEVRRRFRELLPLGNRAEDFGVALAAIAADAELPDQEAYDRFAAGLDPEWLARYHRRFYVERERSRRADPDDWAASQRPYEPFVRLLRRRGPEVELAIATAKDRESVGGLLAAYGIADLFPPHRVLDKETGRSKTAHLEAVRGRLGCRWDEITFVDDKLNHLVSTAPLGVRPVLAGWGYNGERERSEARRRGWAVVTLDDAEAVLFGEPG